MIALDGSFGFLFWGSVSWLYAEHVMNKQSREAEGIKMAEIDFTDENS